MNAAILVVGDELLAGATKDKNAGWLCERLTRNGWRVRRVVFVPDEDPAITEELDRLLPNVDAVLVSGGLGPTHDDRTTAALARHFGRPLVADEAGWKRLQDRYGHRLPAPTNAQVDSARKMVIVPDGATPLANPVGAASGWSLPLPGAKHVIVLPGVPAELQVMFEQEVEGRILPTGTPLAEAEVDVTLPEAAFAHDLARLQDEMPHLSIGSYPHHGEKRVTLRVRGPPEAVAEAAHRLRAHFAGNLLTD